MRRGLRWRVRGVWSGAVFVLPAVLFLVAVGIHMAVGGAPPTAWLAIPSAADLAFLVGALVAGSFGEEVGWRGFALPRLQRRYTPLVASVVIGGVWATWHLWPAITPGGGGVTSIIALETYVRLVAMSVVYTWIFNATNRSLLLVMLAHAGHNVAVRIVSVPVGAEADVSLLVALLYVVLAVIEIGRASCRERV